MWIFVATALAGTPTTLEDVERAAVEANPALQRARAELESADGRLLSSRGAFDPVLGFGPSWSRSVNKGFFQGFPFESRNLAWDLGANLGGRTSFGTTYGVSVGLERQFGEFITDFGVGENESTQDAYTSSLGLSLSQPLLEGWGQTYVTRFVRQANVARTRAELSAASQEQRTIATAATAYWAWAYTVEAHRIAGDAEAAAQEALRVGRLREGAGTIAPIELVRLEAAEVQARTQRLEAGNAAVRAKNAVELAIGVKLAGDAEPVSRPDAPAAAIDEAAALTVALASNPDLLVMRALRDEGVAGVRDAKNTLRPQLDASVATGLGTREDTVGAAVGGLVDGSAFPSVRIGADLSVPLGNRVARGSVDAAAADLHGLEAQVRETETAIATQVAEAALAVRAASQRVELADANARLQKALLAAEEAKVAAGGSIEQELLEVRAAYASARAEAFRSRTDLRSAEVELLRLQGALVAP